MYILNLNIYNEISIIVGTRDVHLIPGARKLCYIPHYHSCITHIKMIMVYDSKVLGYKLEIINICNNKYIKLKLSVKWFYYRLIAHSINITNSAVPRLLSKITTHAKSSLHQGTKSSLHQGSLNVKNSTIITPAAFTIITYICMSYWKGAETDMGDACNHYLFIFQSNTTHIKSSILSTSAIVQILLVCLIIYKAI